MTGTNTFFNVLKFKVASEGTDTDTPFATKLSNINTTLNQQTSNLNATLTKQKQVHNILKVEENRLNEKKQQLDNAQKGQMRVIMLNESYRKRQSQYIKMIIAVVFVFALVIILRFLRMNFDVLPDSVYTLLHIIMFSGVIIYSVIIMMTISARETTNFDRLDIPGPKIEKQGDIDARNTEARKAGNLLGIGRSGVCRGAACCNNSTTFDKTEGKCVVPSPPS